MTQRLSVTDAPTPPGTLRPRTADLTLAHALARIGLGVNMCLHGMTRIPGMDAFQTRLHEQFAGTFLPVFLLDIAAYGILYSEAIVGPFLVAGLFVRQALTGCAMLMIVLLFGTCLSQQFSIATTQMIYLGFIISLLAGVAYDGYSLDALRRRQKAAR
jgi:thiosulfate dehydrogenase [quinone] large subunit